MSNDKHNTFQQSLDNKTTNTLWRRNTRINPIQRHNTNTTVEKHKKYSNNKKNKTKTKLKYPIGLLTTHTQENKEKETTEKEIYRIEEIDNMKVKLRNCKDGTKLETTVNNLQPIYRSEIRDHYPENMSQEIKRICLDIKKDHLINKTTHQTKYI